MVRLSDSMRNAPALRDYKQMINDETDRMTYADPGNAPDNYADRVQAAEEFYRNKMNDDALLQELQNILAKKFFNQNNQMNPQQKSYIRQQYPVTDMEVELDEMYNDPNFLDDYNMNSSKWR